MASSPLIAVPGRFSARASALRFAAVVNARALLEAVRRAGGEPLTVLPDEDLDIGRRLRFADAVLLPGGGDLAPTRYGQPDTHADVYDVDDAQDAFDLAVADWAMRQNVPLLAVCRGLHVVNVALGGTLIQHMETPHRHLTHHVGTEPGSALAAITGPTAPVSCYHHQRIDRLATGLRAVAHCRDGGIEAVEPVDARAFLMAVQWHPEDTAATDTRQAALFDAFVAAA